jgi:histidine phosphotransferase ChpT
LSHSNESLSALVGARICHDVISPLGAVVNGLELLQLSADGTHPEVALVRESAASAAARIRFLRLAFGPVRGGQDIAANEFRKIVTDHFASKRLEVTCRLDQPLSRQTAQVLTLALLCAEQALPHGGGLSVTRQGARWRITAQGARITPDPVLWSLLRDPSAGDEVPAAAVQFLLLPQALASLDLNISTQISDSQAQIAF